MKITSVSVYSGPSIFGRKPVIRYTLELGPLADWSTERLGPTFVDALLEWVPTLRDNSNLLDRHDRGGASLGQVLMLTAIELQNAAGAGVDFGEVRPTGSAGAYDVVYGYEDEEVGLAAGRLALASIQHLLPSQEAGKAGIRPDFDFARKRDAFIRFGQRRALTYSVRRLVEAAASRSIPWAHLGSNLILFGQGRHQRRMWKIFTDQTGNVAFRISSDKALANRILGEIGLPVPRQRVVNDAEAAVRAAESIGYPVVVKPLNADFGHGVSVRRTDGQAVRAAFKVARRYGRAVIVESHIDGHDHRLLVVNGELVAAAKRVPGHVVGDGMHTIEELVEELNRDPRRGTGNQTVLARLRFDEEAKRLLAEAGSTAKTVPGRGEVIYLRGVSNRSAGGTSIDVTETVHPDNRKAAILAAKVGGIDVAGIDFLSPDIGLSYKEVGGGICEINTTPGLGVHYAASQGEPRDVAGSIIEALFPPGAPSRIPIVAITGGAGSTAAARILAHMLELAGHSVGLATNDGVYINGDVTAKGGIPGPAAARMILRNPMVDAAVLQTAPGELLRRGLGCEGCDIGAVLDVTAESSGGGAVASSEQLFEAVRIVVESAGETIVLNADDDLCLDLAGHAEASHLCLATLKPDHPRVREHVGEGGRAVVLEQGRSGAMIAIHDKGDRGPVAGVDLAAASAGGMAAEHLRSALFAAAMAHSLGQSVEDIGRALGSFDFGSL